MFGPQAHVNFDCLEKEGSQTTSWEETQSSVSGTDCMLYELETLGSQNPHNTSSSVQASRGVSLISMFVGLESCVARNRCPSKAPSKG